MPNDQLALHPVDVVVAFRLCLDADASYEVLGRDLGISRSTAYAAIRRLEVAGLVGDERDALEAPRHGSKRRVNRSALLEFVEHGVRYAFPAVRQGECQGIPTAHAAALEAAPEAALLDEEAWLVWPTAHGSARGEAVVPLYPQAVLLPELCPPVYRMVAAVDAIRAGHARERKVAAAALRHTVRGAA